MSSPSSSLYTFQLTFVLCLDKTLKRQGHIHGPVYSYPLPLNIILEEDESRSSSPSSCYSSIGSLEGSSNLDIKARRRHATVSVAELRLSRVFPTDDSFLSSPRPPITSNTPASPDSFKLTFTDVSFKFPHPPIPTPSSLRKYDRDSPTPSLSSSPASQTEAMPLTPSTSDDEFGPSPGLPIIQPLVITKHNPRPSSPFDDDFPISPSLLQPFKISTESSAPLSPLSPSYLAEAYFDESDEEETSDSEPESDSEWYSKELSKIVSLRSPIPSSFPHQTSARPDSVSFLSSTTSGNRASKPLPPTPLSGGFPSPQLDPAYPRRRGSKRRSIPNYPPPPVPTISPTSSSSNSSSSRRPPPRSSIPADCVYDLVDIEEDNSSVFSFSIYDVYLGDEPDRLPANCQASLEEDPIAGVSFDLDSSMMLPLSLPTTPLDLEADIAQGLEQLKNSHVNGRGFVPEIRERDPEQPQPYPRQQHHHQQQQQVVDDIFSPTTSPSTEEKMLKSKWSSSTLSSIREEHENRGPSSKLRHYFSPLKIHKHGSKKGFPNSSSSSRKTPSTLTTPRSPPPPAPPVRSLPSKPTQSQHIRGYSDVMVIGYGNNGNGVRRRGSMTNSDAGSEESYSSTSSSGLRRKPIPVEMFLRSAV